MSRRPFQFDVDAIIGYNREQLAHFLDTEDRYIIQLQDDITAYTHRVRALESEIKYLKDQLKILEEIKVDTKARKGVWKAIAAAAAAAGTLLGSLFFKKE